MEEALEIPKRRLDDNIKMVLMGMGCESVEWIHLAQGRVQYLAFVNTVMNVRIP
jgi:hypothetical protein